MKADRMTNDLHFPLESLAGAPGGSAPSPAASGPIELLTQLAQRKVMIARVTAVSMVIGLLLGLLLPPRYTAVARIMPPKQTQSTTTFLNTQMGMGSLAEAAGGGLGLKDPNAIYVGLLKSRPVADAIIDRFGLAEVYAARDMTGARANLEKNTQVVSEKSTLISISVTDRDRKRAAAIANAYTEQLRAITKTISFSEASNRRIFFEGQLKSQKEALIEAESAFQQVQQNKGLVHLDAQANIVIGSLASLRAQIAAKEVELEALRTYSTERNPQVQLAERELSALEAEAAQLDKRTESTSYSDMGLKDIPSAGMDYIRAARELEYQKAFFDLLLRQYEAARLDEAKEAAVIQVVEQAIEPDRKSAPKRMAILILFTMAGALVGAILAQIERWMELGKSDPERARAFRGLKEAVLGKRPAAVR